MPVFLKILVVLLSYATLWLQIHLDYKNPWKDKRTRLHRFGFLALKYLIVPLAVIATLLIIVYEDRASKNAEAKLSSMGSTLDQIAAAVGIGPQGDLVQAVEGLKDRIAEQERALESANAMARDAQSEVETLRDYGQVARLNPEGVTGQAGAGLVEASPLSKALDGAWNDRDGRLFARCDASSLAKFQRATALSPRFPWGEYGLAVCLRSMRSSTWRDHAKKALEIFEATTKISE